MRRRVTSEAVPAKPTDAATVDEAPEKAVNPALPPPSNLVDGKATSSRGSGEAPGDGGPEDRVLVERVQGGDRAAFEVLFQRYHRRAYAVAFGVVKNKEDALDIVQDAFVKVHRHIGNFQGTSSFYTWLYRILMNLAIDHVRKPRHGKDVDYDDGVGRAATDVEGDGSMLPKMANSNPSKTAVRRELSAKIVAALDELPEYHRAVILMREVEGMSYEEMAQVLEVPKGTIMSRLFHARRKMQESLREYMDGDREIED